MFYFFTSLKSKNVMKMALFWDVAPCSLVDLTDVSEELTAVIALMMETVISSEMSVSIYQTTLCNILEDRCLHTCHHENLKSHKEYNVSFETFSLWFENTVYTGIQHISLSKIHT
jgi:hypothetical protein